MQNPWNFNFVEGGSWKFSQGFKLWENMENILHQIASELVCTHSPLTFMHLPITHCWVVINVTILIQEFLCHTTWDGEGFWEVFCIRQVMQNPQVLGGGGGGSDQDPRPSLWIYHGVLSVKGWQHFSVIYPSFSPILLFKRISLS